MSPAEEEFLTLLKELLSVSCPSGREERLAAIVRRHLDQLGYAHETDGAGNVLVRMEGRSSSQAPIVFAAHMDEIGMVVTEVQDDGTLCVDRSGGLLPHKIGERPVEVLGDSGSVTGVLSYGTGHVAAADKAITWNQVRVLTGLSKVQLKAKGIRTGSTAVPITEGRGPLVFGDPAAPMIGAWTMDDRAGVALLLQLLRRMKEQQLRPPVSAIFAFTIHEEGGCHGAKVLAHREKPSIFIAVDGCPWMPGIGVTVSDQPTAFTKDLLAHYDQRLIRTFAEAARNAGTELQTAVLSAAYSDASAVYNTGGAPRVGIIGHTRFNSHGFEVARLGVFPRVLDTLVALIKMSDW